MRYAGQATDPDVAHTPSVQDKAAMVILIKSANRQGTARIRRIWKIRYAGRGADAGVAPAPSALYKTTWEILIRSTNSSVQQDHDAFGKCATPGKLPTPA